MQTRPGKKKPPIRGKTTAVGGVVWDLVDKIERQLSRDDRAVFEQWETAAGTAGRHTVPTDLREKVLYVDVDSGARMFQLKNFEAAKIRGRINRSLGREAVKKIVFKNSGR